MHNYKLISKMLLKIPQDMWIFQKCFISTSEMRIIMKALILLRCQMVLFMLAQPYSSVTQKIQQNCSNCTFVSATSRIPLFLQCFPFLSFQLSLRKDKAERLSPISDHYGPEDGSDNKESSTLGCSTPHLSSQSIHIT